MVFGTLITAGVSSEPISDRFLATGELRNLLKASETEKKRLHAEVKKLRTDLAHFNPAFFEELEDLKFNYNAEVKKSVLLEEELRKVCGRFGVPVNVPDVTTG